MTQRTLAVILAVLVAMTLVPAPAAAGHAAGDDSFLDDFVDSDGETVVEEALRIAASAPGKVAKLQSRLFDRDDGDASEHAADFQTEFNTHNESTTAWVNDHVDADSDRDVFELVFADRDGNSATVYLVADVTDGDYANARVVDQETFDGLNRTVDHTVEADWFLSRHAASEFETFHSDFVDEDENLTRTYKAKMVSKYGDSVESDLWGDDV